MFSGSPDELEEFQRDSRPRADIKNPFPEIARRFEIARRDRTGLFARIDLTAVEVQLKALPVRQKATLRATIERLAPTLMRLKDRGYSLDDLAAELKVVGITVSARGLARYLRAEPPKASASAMQ